MSCQVSDRYPDKLRMDEDAVRCARDLFDSEKPVASIMGGRS